MFNIYKLKRSYTVVFFFSLIFILSIFLVKDYGVSNDEYQERITGFTTLKYIGEKIIPKTTDKFQADKNIQDLHDYQQKVYGVVFNAPTAFLEIVLKIKEKKNQFLMRHYVNFLIYFIGLIFFFLVLEKRFKNWQIAIIGTLILFLSPRIFAHSFYNNRDIILLSLFIISFYFNIDFIEKRSLKSAILAAFFTAITIDTRIVGVIVLLNTSFVYFLNILKLKNFKQFSKIFYYLIFTFIFIIFFWPFLWENPLQNFLMAFKAMSNYFLEAENLYLGKYISNKELPWHYIFVWIGVTTPIFYLFLFLVGLIKFIVKLIKSFKTNFNHIQIEDIYSFNILFGSIFAIIIFNSTLYNGWRHLYFIYPFLVFFSLVGFKYLFEKKKLYQNYIYIIILVINFILTSHWIFKNHPFQYVYFNNLINKKNLQKKFDLDYWGLSYKQSIQYLLNNEKEEKLIVYNMTKYNKLFYHLFSFDKISRDRIIVSKNKDDAKFILTNYHNDKNEYKKNFFDNYELYHEIRVDGFPINSIYKRKN